MKNKVLIIFILFISFSFFSKVLANELCSKNGYTILTVNGIFTDENGALYNRNQLARNLLPTYNNQPLTVDYVYNSTHNIIVDSLDVMNQKIFEQNSLNIQDSDFVHMLQDASQKVNTQKLLLVGHSQGNFYTNTFYDAVANELGGIPSESIGVYAVATPANYVAGNGLYITSDTDKVIAGFVGNLPLVSTLKPNAHINFKISDGDPNGHGFSEIYLPYEGDRIISEIGSSLNKLRNNNIQNEQLPCISLPKLTITQKVQSALLASTDFIIINTYNAGAYIADKIQNTTLAIGNMFGGLFAGVVESLPDSSNLTTLTPDILNNEQSQQNSTDTNKETQKIVVNTDKEILVNNPNTKQISEEEKPIEEIQISTEKTENSLSTIQNREPTTTEENNITNPESEYPNLLPGGGGMAATDISPSSDISEDTSDVSDDTSGTSDTTPPDDTENPLEEDDISPTQNDSTSDITDPISFLESDLNENGIADSDENEVILMTNKTLSAGAYRFNNLILNDNVVLTLEGNSDSQNNFKGVRIDVFNLTLDPGSIISANGKGYVAHAGLGASSSSNNNGGASYGGIGYANTSTVAYGSVLFPTDLGSGGERNGGGAMRIIVGNKFINNGLVSADGDTSASGGSIYITTNDLSGNGNFHANGGSLWYLSSFVGPGGGGRIAIYYKTSSFTGETKALGGCGSYDSSTSACAGSGTVGLFDITKNDLYVPSVFEFQKNDSPFNFHNIVFDKNAKVTSEDGVTLNAENLLIKGNSSFILFDNQTLNIPTVTLDESSTLTFSDNEMFNVNILKITGNSIVTAMPEKILSLTIPNIIIDSGSSISVNGKGYEAGPGASSTINIGASYGGVGGNNIPNSIYGSATKPVDFGSGVASSIRGGGVIKLNISDTLENNGEISADGLTYGSSGGSVYITVNNIKGNGNIHANGGDISWPNIHSGGGGRVAIYYKNSSFDGVASAQAGNYCFYGCNLAAQNGTVGFFDLTNNDLILNSSWRFQKNDEPFDFNHIVVNNNAKIFSENNVNITANDMLINGKSSFNLSDNQVLNIPIITLDGGSTLIFSENEIFNSNDLIVTGNSSITVLPEKILFLTIPNITIDSGSSINVDEKGYITGPGSPLDGSFIGASYGGVGGNNTLTSVYGSSIEPIDFGSGAEGSRGGGAIRLIINNNFKNDGIVSANGVSNRTSGGSIYVTANNILGTGSFYANGGGTSWPNQYAGAGGRIALYYQNLSYTPIALAKGGEYCFSGCNLAAQNGTVVTGDAPKIPESIPDTTPPLVTSYTFNDKGEDITINPTSLNPLLLTINTNEKVNWKSIQIEKNDNNSIYKEFRAGNNCENGSLSCIKSWDGETRGGLQNGIYRIHLHMEDLAGNEFYDYLTPYIINVDTSI